MSELKKIKLKNFRKVGQTIAKHHLLCANDKIAVGLSGGKDSFFLLEALAYCKNKLPFPIEIIAIHVFVEGIGYKGDASILSKFCDQLSIPFHYINTHADPSVNPKKPPCFICSWTRRKRLYEITKQLKCNKLTLGHHRDDAIQTMMMNMIWHGSISSMPFRLRMFEGKLELIRPLLDIPEKEIIAMNTLDPYPLLQKDCPYSDTTKRDNIKKLLEDIEKLNPLARINMFRSMNKIFPEYLPIDGQAMEPKDI